MNAKTNTKENTALTELYSETLIIKHDTSDQSFFRATKNLRNREPALWCVNFGDVGGGVSGRGG